MSVSISLLFFPVSGEVLVPTHLIHPGGNHNCYIHPWFTHYPHKGKISTCAKVIHLFVVAHLFDQNLNPFVPSVLLCDIKQQVLQCHRTCPRSDHGECAASYLSHNMGYKEQIKQEPLIRRGCTLCRLCC